MLKNAEHVKKKLYINVLELIPVLFVGKVYKVVESPERVYYCRIEYTGILSATKCIEVKQKLQKIFTRDVSLEGIGY